MIENKTIARPYAQAVFDLADENGTLDQWSQFLNIASNFLSDATITFFLSKPTLSKKQKFDLLIDFFNSIEDENVIFGNQDLFGSNFLKLLIESNRMTAINEISEQFDALKLKAEKNVEVIVTSASPLSSIQQESIAQSLKIRLNCNVIMQTDIDKSLIGGVVIRAGDIVIDGSLRTSLEQLNNVMTI